MEAIGLTVRSYVPEPSKRKFPRASPLKFKTKGKSAFTSSKMATLEPRLLDRCIDKLKEALADWQIETDKPTPYALIADAGLTDKTKPKRLLIAIVPKQRFKDFEESDMFTSNGCSYRILACVDHDEVHLDCEEKEFESFFRKPDLYFETQWCDVGAQEQASELERKAREKKEAKRLRQKMGGEGGALQGGQQDCDEEELKAKAEAKKAREKEKKKNKQARKKEEEVLTNFFGVKKSEAGNRFWILTKTPRDKPSSSAADRAAATPRIFGRQAEVEEHEDECECDDCDEGEAEGAELEVLTMGDGDSVQDMARAVVRAKGKVMIGYPKVEEKKPSGGLKYLGRGL